MTDELSSEDFEPLELDVAHPEPVVVDQPSKVLWGTCRVTAYCPCEKCCGQWALDRPINPSTGEPIVYGAANKELTSGVSVASTLPLGTRIYIPELDREFVVEDRTAGWIEDKYNDMIVDIYISDHDACYDFLSGHNDWMEVYIVGGNI